SSLSPNTTYYTRVQTLNVLNQPTTFTYLSPAVTLASPPIKGTPAFGAITNHSIEAFWTSVNPAGTRFLIEAVGQNDGGSVNTTDPATAVVDGLTPDTDYAVYATAINHQGQK